MVSDPLQAQYSVLGALLIEPSLMAEAMTQVRSSDFGNTSCRLVWSAMESLFLAGAAIDPVTVRDKLVGFDDAGQFLVQLMEITPTAANFGAYLQILKKQSTLTTLQRIGTALQTAESLEDALALVDKANAASIARPGVTRYSAEAMVKDFFERHSSGKKPEYISWGIDKLDANVYAERGDFVVIGGYPSAGKTALSLGFAWHMAKKYRVGYYSLETNREKVEDRSMSTLAGIDLTAIKKGTMTSEDWEKAAQATTWIPSRGIYAIPANGMTVADIRADALANRYDVIFIDYLQLLPKTNPRETNRVAIVTDISIGLHNLAQSTGITVVALSQLSRPETVKGRNAAPDMHSLRESGQLEQDADVVMLLYLEEPDTPSSRRVLKIAKNKEGELGRFYLDFNGSHQRFTVSDQGPKKSLLTRMREAAKGSPEESDKQAEMEQQSFAIIEGEDPQLPFGKN